MNRSFEERPMGRILLIEDEELIKNQIKNELASYGDVHALDLHSQITPDSFKGKYDLIIADYYLGNRNCFEFIEEYRYFIGAVPMILMSGKPSIEMLQEAIDLKVFTFINKPVDINDLKKKVEKFYNFNPDFSLYGHKIILYKDDWTVKVDAKLHDLTETEFKIFRYAIERQNQVIDRQELIKHLWGNSISSRNKLDTHLTNLKNKVNFVKEKLQTIPRVGYKFKDE